MEVLHKMLKLTKLKILTNGAVTFDLNRGVSKHVSKRSESSTNLEISIQKTRDNTKPLEAFTEVRIRLESSITSNICYFC